MDTRAARAVGAILALALAASGTSARAQVLEAPASDLHGPVPSVPGRGAQVQFVRAFFGGFPPSLADAQQLIAGTAFVPAFDTWCGTVPYVDFTNATVRDSLGFQSPSVMCLPFLDPMRSMPAATCRSLAALPTGMYYENGGAAMRVRGYLAVRSPGTYTLAWGHDDGFGFYLGDTTVFEYVNPTGSRVDRRAVHFATAGLYEYRLDWFDAGGGALIDWYVGEGDHTAETWNGTDFHLVPTEDLYAGELLPCTRSCTPCGAAAPHCDLDRSRCVQCRDSADCGGCEACVEGTCHATVALPGTDAGPGCPTDGGGTDGPGRVADGGAVTPDAAVLDAGMTANVAAGCGCAVPSRKYGGAMHNDSLARVALAVALALTIRRRRMDMVPGRPA